MIAGMARAGALLAERRYVEAAARAAGFILARLKTERGLLHAWRGGEARIPAFLDDYAFLVDGLLALHEAEGGSRWLEAALDVQAEQDRRLWDERGGGYFGAGEDPRLLFRAKPAHDGALASGNGMAALNLVALGALTGNAAFREKAGRVLSAFGRGMQQHPLAHVTLVQALLRHGSVEAGQVEPSAAASGPESEAAGVVELTGRLGLETGDGTWRAFQVELRIADGWHVNAHPAGAEFLVATEVRPLRGPLRNLRYPAGTRLRAAPAEDEIAVYAGTVVIEGEIDTSGVAKPAVTVVCQPCDAGRCLAPVTLPVRLVSE
jgi:hypothetical protein